MREVTYIVVLSFFVVELAADMDRGDSRGLGTRGARAGGGLFLFFLCRAKERSA